LKTNRRITIGASLCGFVSGWEATTMFFLFPEIRDVLASGDATDAAWILTITGVISSSLLLQGGRLGEKYGYQNLYKWGILFFAFTNLLCALSPNLWFLIAFRGLTAVSLAIISPLAAAILVAKSTSDSENMALARVGIFVGVSGVAGPIVITLLIDSFSWRFGYFSQIPIALLAAFLSWKDAEVPGRNTQRKIDFLDSALAVFAVAFLVFSLSKADEWGWLSINFLGTLVLSLSLTYVFLQRSKVSNDPQIPLPLFKRRKYRFTSFLAFTIACIFFSHWLVLLLYLTDIWNFGLIKASVILTVMPGMVVLTSIPTGRMADKYGHFPVILTGITVYTLGFLQFWIFADEKESILCLLITVTCAGFGMGTIWQLLSVSASQNVQPDRIGSALAFVNSIQRVGSAFGIALAATLTFSESGQPTVALYQRGIAFIVIVALISMLLTFGLRDNKDRAVKPVN
jgi:MFS family permease|tara:strand:+ start:1227 stop:2600 length:1374 start_codon:yes stop_codon:yes gene_type:complete